MLTHQQILHFRTFGYVTLSGLLSAAEAATLRQEVAGALAGAFGQIATDPNDLGGISGDYLPLAVNRAPLSLALIADDSRTFQSSAELLGSPTVPSIGIATCFTGDSSWHTRQGPDVGGVTFWADLDHRTAGTGALRLVPGSHLPEFERRLCEYRAAEPATSGFGHWEWPHVVVETKPGDVVAFHAHLMNRAQGETPRLSWTIDYLPWPGLGRRDQMKIVRDLIRDDAEFDHEDYDRTAGRSGGNGRPAPPRFPPARSRWSGLSCSACWARRTLAERFMTVGGPGMLTRPGFRPPPGEHR